LWLDLEDLEIGDNYYIESLNSCKPCRYPQAPLAACNSLVAAASIFNSP
jgi:hypothetical protein